MSFMEISEFAAQMFFNALVISLMISPIIVLMLIIRAAMKNISYVLTYNIWCVTGCVIIVLLVISIMILSPIRNISQNHEKSFSVNDIEWKVNNTLEYESGSELQIIQESSEVSKNLKTKIEYSDNVNKLDLYGNESDKFSVNYIKNLFSTLVESYFINIVVKSSDFINDMKSNLLNGHFRFVSYVTSWIWLLMSFALTLKNIVQYITLKRKLNSACLYKFGNYADLYVNIGLVHIYESEFVLTPFSTGLIRSVIFMPSGLNDICVKNVLKHELVHIDRHDPFKMFAASFLIFVFWFNPLIWAAAASFRKDMEFSCDHIAVRSMNVSERRLYANVLLDLSCQYDRKYPLLVFMSDKKYFESRVMNIFNKEAFDKKWYNRLIVLLVGILMIALVITCCFVFADDHTNLMYDDKNKISVKDDEFQGKINACFEGFTDDGKIVNAVFLDSNGKTAVSFGNPDISVVPGSAISPVIAAVLMENDSECMDISVPLNEISLNGGANIKNWNQNHHDGQGILLSDAFKEMSNPGKIYAVLNAEDNVVNTLANIYGINNISVNDENARYMLASGQYKIKLSDLAAATAMSMGETEFENGLGIDLDLNQRAELNELFRESLSWYYNYRTDIGGCDYADNGELTDLSKSIKTAGAFGLSITDDGNQNVQSVCAGTVLWRNKPVYFTVQVLSDDYESIVTGDEVICLLEQIF